MIYQTEWVMPDWVFTIFEPTIWWLTVAIFLLLGVYMRKKMQENESARDFLKGISAFMFLFGIARALENIRRYMISESSSDILDGWIGNAPIISGANMVLRIGYYAVSWTGIAYFFFISEKNVFKQKYYFTTAAVAEGVFSILMYFGFPDIVMYSLLILSSIGFLFAAVIPVSLYLRLGYKNPGSLGRASYLTGIGCIICIWSYVRFSTEVHL